MSAYNTSKSVIKRMRPLLEELTGDPVAFRCEDAEKLAYKLREAFAAARRHKVEPWASHPHKFIVETDKMVRAVPKVQTQRSTRLVPTKNITRRCDHFDVVQEASAKKQEKSIAFHDFRGDVSKIKRWAKTMGFRVTEDPLTLWREEAEE